MRVNYTLPEAAVQARIHLHETQICGQISKCFFVQVSYHYNQHYIRSVDSVLLYTGMNFFIYLTDFSYFSVKKEIPKIAGHSQNMLKMTF